MGNSFNKTEYASTLTRENIAFKTDYPASELTTFRIGGPVSAAVFPKSESEMITAMQAASAAGLRYIVLGKGSNVLVSDKGFDGAVITTVSMNGIRTAGDMIIADCGAAQTAVAVAAYEAGLTGAEFYYGIPGTVGGALYMNSGAFNGQTSDIVVASRVYDRKSGRIFELTSSEHDFSYRSSIFSKDGTKIALSAVFSLKQGDREEIRWLMDSRMEKRREKQPLEYPSAGSVFKRYDGFFTAKLIDEAGLKGRTVGGAQVSEKHAGFIVNKGGATAADVLELIGIIKDVIYKNNGVSIECEVEYIE